MSSVSDGVVVTAGPLDWGGLYERYAGEIARYLYKATGDKQVAMDLLHDTFVNAMSRQNQLRDRARVRPWLYRIATNLAISDMRRRRRRSWLTVVPARQDDPAARAAEGDLVRRVLGSLAPHQAVMLVLRERGFTRDEIAEMSGVSPETVKSRLARGEANFVAAYRRLERGLVR